MIQIMNNYQKKTIKKVDIITQKCVENEIE